MCLECVYNCLYVYLCLKENVVCLECFSSPYRFHPLLALRLTQFQPPSRSSVSAAFSLVSFSRLLARQFQPPSRSSVSAAISLVSFSRHLARQFQPPSRSSVAAAYSLVRFSPAICSGCQKREKRIVYTCSSNVCMSIYVLKRELSGMSMFE